MSEKIATKERLAALRDKRLRAREAALRLAKPIIGKEATRELEELVSGFDERNILWLAGLYDPEVGAFYYSYSARNTELFLPDVESTVQAFRTVSVRGSFENEAEPYIKMMPQAIRKKAVEFVLSLQAPDGYFYHPQWGRRIPLTRRGRDLGWCRQFLYEAGVRPRFPLPLEKDKDGNASTLLPPHLSSLDYFREYLAEKDLSKNSYIVGNIIDCETSQIRAAGKEYCDLVLSWLAEHQRPETGLWQDEVCYNSVNGMYKIAMSHPGLGGYVPNAVNCIKSAIKVILLDEPIPHIFACVSPWTAISGILRGMPNNLGMQKARECRALVVENAAEMIRRTRDKLSACYKPDGSYSYFSSARCQTAEFSQGVPVSSPFVDEGDVNSTGGARGVVRCLCSSLGIPNVPIVTREDMQFFFELLENAEKVVKTEKNPYGSSLPMLN